MAHADSRNGDDDFMDIARAFDDMQKFVSFEVGKLHTRIDGLQAEMTMRFERVERRFEAVDQRLDRMDQRFEAVDERLDEMDGRFDALDQRLDQMDGRFEVVEQRLDAIDLQFSEVGRRFDQIDGKLDLLLKALGGMPQA